MPSSTYNRGLFAAILSFAIWGFFPIYWRLLATISSIELLNIRLILTALTCLAIFPFRGTLGTFFASWKEWPTLRRSLLAAVLLSGNWFAFIWAVNSGNILESSLGYFLCPLVSVLLGRFILKESLNKFQWIAVILAGVGVSSLILLAGRIPTAALVIAFTWSGYGLIKKRSQLGPVVGLGLETGLLSPFALVALIYIASRSPLTLSQISPDTAAILAFSGLLTAAPLLLFAYSAPRIRLSTIGMGQYIVPSCHFILAYSYGEELSPVVLGGFAMIWAGLLLYALSGSRNKSI